MGGALLREQEHAGLLRGDAAGIVRRTDPVQLHHLRVDPLGGQEIRSIQNGVDHGAVGAEGQILSLPQDGILADFRIAAVTAARIANRNRAVHIQNSSPQHRCKLGLVRGAEDPHAGDLPQEAYVEDPVVGLAVSPNQAGPIHRKHHMKLQDRNIVDQHIIGPLEEGGIDRNHRDHSLLGKPGGHCHGVALRYAGVTEALRMLGGKGIQACAALHGGSNGADAGIFVRKRGKGGSEGLGEADGPPSCGGAGLRIEGADAVEQIGVLLRRLIALSFLRDHVQDHGLFQISGLHQLPGQFFHVMSVHRAEVLIAHIVEHIGADQALFQALLEMVDAVINGAAHTRRFRGRTPGLFELVVTGPLADIGEVLRHRAYVWHNGHPVVVENDDQRLPAGARVIQALIGQAARQSTVAHQRDHIVVFPPQCPGPGHSQGNGNRVGRVAGNEGVMHTLAGLWEPGEAVQLTKRRKTVGAAGQKLMHIGLVSYVKNQSVFGCIKNTVDGDRELHDAQIGRQMAAGRGDLLHQEAANIIAEGFQLRPFHGAKLLCRWKMHEISHFCILFFLENRCLKRQISFAARCTMVVE